eukprot:g807.t1
MRIFRNQRDRLVKAMKAYETSRQPAMTGTTPSITSTMMSGVPDDVVSEPMWFMKIRKNQVVRDLTRTVTSLSNHDPTKMWRRAVVIYDQTETVDAGGLYKDLMNRFFRAILDPRLNLFESASSTAGQQHHHTEYSSTDSVHNAEDWAAGDHLGGGASVGKQRGIPLDNDDDDDSHETKNSNPNPTLNEYYLPSSQCELLGCLEAIGKLLAKCVLENIVISCRFSPIVYKFLLLPSHNLDVKLSRREEVEEFGFHDLALFDPVLESSLRNNVLGKDITPSYRDSMLGALAFLDTDNPSNDMTKGNNEGEENKRGRRGEEEDDDYNKRESENQKSKFEKKKNKTNTVGEKKSDKKYFRNNNSNLLSNPSRTISGVLSNVNKRERLTRFARKKLVRSRLRQLEALRRGFYSYIPSKKTASWASSSRGSSFTKRKERGQGDTTEMLSSPENKICEKMHDDYLQLFTNLTPHDFQKILCGPSEITLRILCENIDWTFSDGAQHGWRRLRRGTHLELIDKMKNVCGTWFREIFKGDRGELGNSNTSSSSSSKSSAMVLNGEGNFKISIHDHHARKGRDYNSTTGGRATAMTNESSPQMPTSVTLCNLLLYLRKRGPQYCSQFLHFVTGTPTVPYEGLQSIDPRNGPTGATKIVIQFTPGSKSKLPEAHTCFNTLILPDYDDALTLEKKFDEAIFALGFHLI